MPQFEWDKNKNSINKKKHRVSFEKAKEVFEDDDAIEKLGNSKTEVRFLRVGKTVETIILAVVYTLRTTVIRIISARQASRKEINAYIEHKFNKSEPDENQH